MIIVYIFRYKEGLPFFFAELYYYVLKCSSYPILRKVVTMKIREFIYKNRFFIYGGLFTLGFPILLNYCVFSWRAPGVNGDWMEFLGSYLGAIIGVIIVYTTAKMQIIAQNIENEFSRNFQIRPYLRAEQCEEQSNNAENITFHIISPSDDFLPPEFSNLYGKGSFSITNIGLGTAVDIQFKVEQFMHRYTSNNSALLVREQSEFNVFTFLHSTSDFHLIVIYSDMLGNKYKQVISFSTIKVSEERGYELKVNNTSPPEIADIHR